MFEEIDSVKEAVKRETTKVSEQLSSGGCETFEEYRYLVGLIDGLNRSCQIMEDYVKNIVSSMDKD